ncbi:MAG TPA: PIG-L deacetylase family protein [Acidimicrobiales bacterium]|jgi:LmbE family N-acetylglucosaminyl deacetylase|nr:PIG-L deacetylase family protein [Acidimicrobiales bacterium]
MPTFDAPRCVLVVVAHPDDVDFGSAGTVASLTAAGATVTYCLVTSGEAGPPEDMDRAELRRVREAEQRAAAAIVGVEDVRFLGYPDGRVQATLELRRDISRVVRDVRPDVVISHSGDRVWDRVYFSHPDHLAVGQATAAAVYPDSRNPWAHPELIAEGYQPHTVERMWVNGLDANLYIDITDVFDRKIAALRSHASQVSSRDNLDETLRSWAAANAQAAGWREGRLAEGYREIDAR